MEIRHEPVDGIEVITGRNEQVRIGAMRLQLASARSGLQRAQAGRADGDDLATGRFRGLHGSDRVVGNRVPLTMHLVRGKVFRAHGLERAGADMQRDEREIDAFFTQPREQDFIKMQARRRCGHRAGGARIDRLVTRFIMRISRMVDVRRQRQAAMRVNQREHVVGKCQREKFADARADNDIERIRKPDHGARRRRLRGAHLRMHGMAVNDALDEDFDLAAGFLDAKKPRFQHACIVKHQQVARCEQVHHVGKRAVHDCIAIEMQQTRRAALRQRCLGNQFRRQIKIKIGK